MHGSPLVFLDLEETLIDNWEEMNLNLRGLRRTKAFLNELMMDSGMRPTVGLMSWAVWDARDLSVFETKLRPFLEAELGFKFDNAFLWSMDEWCKQLFVSSRKKLERSDLFDIFGKEETLFRMSRFHQLFANREVFLVDDTVSHWLQVEVPKNGCIVTLLNVLEMDD